MSLTGDVLAALQTIGARLKRETATARAQATLTGGGTITVDSGGSIKWSNRFIVITTGRGAHFSTLGYFDIVMPPVGATITGVGGAPDRAVTSAGVPLNAWDALYYVLPVGNAYQSIDANYRVASYQADFVIPDNWVLLALRSGDANGGVRLGIGRTVLTNSATTAENPSPQYSLDGHGHAASAISGLGTSATRNVGTTSGTVAAGDDSRLADARTPVDLSVTFAKFAAAAIAASGESSAVKLVRADDSRLADPRPPTAHGHASTDITGLGNAATRNVGTAAGTVAAGDDSRFLAISQLTHHANRYSTLGPTIQHNVATLLLWNVADTLDGFTYNAATGEFTVPVKGRYHLAAACTWGAATAGYRSIRFAINGVVDRFHNDDSPASLSSSHESFPMKLAANDKITVVVLQTSGSPLVMNGSQTANWIVLSYLGPSA